METLRSIADCEPATAMPWQRVVSAYVAEARSECLRYLRAPSFILPMLLFSTVFYLMFGVVGNPAA